MTNLIIHPEVADDLAGAAAWYRDSDPELAERFLVEVYAAMERAKNAPLQHSSIHTHYRRVNCERFPYRVIYEFLEPEQTIHIVAVFHQSRQPDAWKNRL